MIRKTGLMAFLVALVIGGGLNIIDYLGASGEKETQDKMEQAKEVLLSEPVKTLKIQYCEITIKALKVLGKDKEDIVLKLSGKNPTKKEVPITLPIRVDRTISSAEMRMVPEPVTILKKEINVTIPAESSHQEDITIVSSPKSTAEVTPTDTKARILTESVTTYSIFVIQPNGGGEDVATLMCAFTVNN